MLKQIPLTGTKKICWGNGDKNVDFNIEAFQGVVDLGIILHTFIHLMVTFNLCLRVFPDAPRLEPLTENGSQEQEDDSDGESDDQEEDEPSLAKKKRVVLKRNFRHPSHESKVEHSGPPKESP